MEPAATQTAGVQPPEVFWILLVGDSKTGKTSLVNRLLTDTFTLKHRPTEGAYSKQHPLQLGGKDARLQVSFKCCSFDAFPVLHNTTPNARAPYTLC